MYCGELGIDYLRHVEVVETHDRNVLGYPASRRLERLYYAHGDKIVGGEHGREIASFQEKLCHGYPTVLGAVATEADDFIVDVYTAALHRVHIRIVPLDIAAVVGIATDERYAPVPF